MPKGNPNNNLANGDEDYYYTLGVTRDADISQIRAEYVAKARQFHPDALVGRSKEDLNEAGLKMARLNKAWEVLSDPVTRSRYDMLLAANQYRPNIAGGAANKVGKFLGKLYSEYSRGKSP